MRIAFVSTLGIVPWGGSEELWYETAVAAKNAGYDVFASVFEPTRDAPKIKQLSGLGVKFDYRKFDRTLVDRGISKLRRTVGLPGKNNFVELEKFGPDIVVVNNGASYDVRGLPDLVECLSKNKMRYVSICQGHDDVPFYSEAERYLVREFFEKADWVGFVAEENLRSAQRNLASPLLNGRVLRNPVNLSDITELPLTSDSTMRIASIARLESTHKGQDVLLEALSGDEWKSRSWRLSFVGEGPHRTYLEELAELYKIKDKVEFLGQVSDIRGVWEKHHMLVIASRYEGTPLALVEAMLCGRPAVVTNVAGNCEWITDSVNGFVAECPTSWALSHALNRAWERRSELPSMGAKARETALSMYDPKPGETVLRYLEQSGGNHRNGNL